MISLNATVSARPANMNGRPEVRDIPRPATKPATGKFEAGRTYWTRSIVDHDFIVRVTVAKRTAKTITTTEGKTLRISEWNGVEQVKPWGSYSMCPIVGADRVEGEA